MNDPSTARFVSLYRSRAFWSQLVPFLAITEDHAFERETPWPLPFGDEAAFRAALDHDGYVHLPQIMEPELSQQLAAAVGRLAAAGIPPIFCLVFDAFWVPAFRLAAIARAAFGADHAILPAIWIWHVDPAKSERGFSPHREVGHEALFTDRRPKALSAWYAFTEATPLNGCMYVVPADRDPTYGTPDDRTHSFMLQDIRALPAEAGDVFLWNHALLHWGAHASPRGGAPRISMSFEFMHRAVEPRYTPVIETATIHRFEDRLRIVAEQVLRYRHLYDLPPEMEAVVQVLRDGNTAKS